MYGNLGGKQLGWDIVFAWGYLNLV
jgi:hypothetical protein